MTQRVIHVSNRLNVPEPGAPPAPAGGLDELICKPHPDYKQIRVGWSGKPPKGEFNVSRDVHIYNHVNGTTYIQVDIPDEIVKGAYSGMQNGLKWPAFHGMLEHVDTVDDSTFRHQAQMVTKYNKIMAQAVAHVATPEDTIIAHDYHLLEAGKHLRSEGLNNPLGFFLHIPMIDSTAIKGLDKQRQDYLYGQLSNLYHFDSVMLHTPEDVRNFYDVTASNSPPNSIERYKTYSAHRVSTGGSVPTKTEVGFCPAIGHTGLYHDQAQSYSGSREFRDTLKSINYGAPRVGALGWERADYTKGIVNKYKGIARALEGMKKRELLSFLQVAPVGRQEVVPFQLEVARVKTAHEMLTEVHGADVATLHLSKVDRHLLLGAARQSDALIITPLKDGLNLTMYEGLAANYQNPTPSTGIYSKRAGAAQILPPEAAIFVDPLRPIEIAEAYKEVAGRVARKDYSHARRMNEAGMEVIMSMSNEGWQRSLVDLTASAATRRAPVAAAVTRLSTRHKKDEHKPKIH